MHGMITRGAAVAIDDFIDNCAEIKPGEEVVLAAHIDGLYGGDNLVDPQALAWLQAAIQSRGANASILWRYVDHSETCTIHMHIGAVWPTPREYPYWLHITADLRTATWRVGDRGHLTALDHPKVKEIAGKYPDRPGLKPWPRNY